MGYDGAAGGVDRRDCIFANPSRRESPVPKIASHHKIATGQAGLKPPFKSKATGIEFSRIFLYAVKVQPA